MKQINGATVKSVSGINDLFTIMTIKREYIEDGYAFAAICNLVGLRTTATKFLNIYMANDLISQIKRDEGLRLSPYRDSVGKLTIGYGRNLSDEGISQDEADFMLSNDIREHASALSKALPWTDKLDAVRQAALINMCFNMGIAGLMGFRRALTMMEAGQWSAAAAAFLASKWATQVGDRAKRLAIQITTGDWQ